MLVTVVVSPAKKGKAPHTPHPIAPKKNNLLYSFTIILEFFFNDINVNGKRIIKTAVHLQKANEIGGTNSTPPLATTKLEAMKIGCINKSDNAKKLFFLLDNLILIYFLSKKASYTIIKIAIAIKI